MPDRFVGRARTDDAIRHDAPRPTTSGTVRGRADKPDVATQAIRLPDATQAIFVDRSGRRGRRLRWTAYAVLLLVLVLLALLWLSQVAVVG
ncbi:hypothetical protein Ais01nite_50230 [Asanoa ishikariensis]|uniref:Uncharacterized protein n=1 Tax=Asanoa ishikariensis TaxID=137265 RepID=A0A1H3RPE0_9ACTN|nr:hypothetical protein [Asanoa ishikariensis]GIF66988.1 hypothetical protein Ais01nite_50230 [Asanoa ishikariensis]SDZ27500.1 hypothetical protein SAMN05421684_4058 [Asanoa ishikariensis]